MSSEQAIEDFETLIIYVIRMLCVGVVHGDLSEFNVLVDAYGPVIIDLPQAVDASANNNAKAMLIRDVNNMVSYYGQFAPELLGRQYAEEMWALYEKSELTPDSQLTGSFLGNQHKANVDSVLEEIKAAFEEEEARLERIKTANEIEES
jgi:RIO kinase 1